MERSYSSPQAPRRPRRPSSFDLQALLLSVMDSASSSECGSELDAMSSPPHPSRPLPSAGISFPVTEIKETQSKVIDQKTSSSSSSSAPSTGMNFRKRANSLFKRKQRPTNIEEAPVPELPGKAEIKAAEASGSRPSPPVLPRDDFTRAASHSASKPRPVSQFDWSPPSSPVPFKMRLPSFIGQSSSTPSLHDSKRMSRAASIHGKVRTVSANGIPSKASDIDRVTSRSPDMGRRRAFETEERPWLNDGFLLVDPEEAISRPALQRGRSEKAVTRGGRSRSQGGASDLSSLPSAPVPPLPVNKRISQESASEQFRSSSEGQPRSSNEIGVPLRVSSRLRRPRNGATAIARSSSSASKSSKASTRQSSPTFDGQPAVDGQQIAATSSCIAMPPQNVRAPSKSPALPARSPLRERRARPVNLGPLLLDADSLTPMPKSARARMTPTPQAVSTPPVVPPPAKPLPDVPSYFDLTQEYFSSHQDEQVVFAGPDSTCVSGGPTRPPLGKARSSSQVSVQSRYSMMSLSSPQVSGPFCFVPRAAGVSPALRSPKSGMELPPFSRDEKEAVSPTTPKFPTSPSLFDSPASQLPAMFPAQPPSPRSVQFAGRPLSTGSISNSSIPSSPSRARYSANSASSGGSLFSFASSSSVSSPSSSEAPGASPQTPVSSSLAFSQGDSSLHKVEVTPESSAEMMALTHDLASDKAYSPQTATVALHNGLGLTLEGADATLAPVQRTLRRIDSGHSAAFVAELRQKKQQRDELLARSSSLGE
ncbi:unnamed protein product [Jaminaea pallidilutea]